MSPSPAQAQSFLLAEKVFRDAVGGGYIIAGTFNQIFVAKAGIRMSGFWAYMAVTGVHANFKWAVRWKDAQSDSMISETFGDAVSPTNPNQPNARFEHAIALHDLEVPHHGAYELELLFNDVRVSAIQVLVLPAQSTKKGEG